MILVTALRDPTSTGALDAKGWTALLTIARAEQLIGTLANRLAEQEMPGLVAAILDDARTNAEYQKRTALWEADCARRALASYPGKVVLMKGTAYVAADLMAGQGRHIGDLDIMVAQDDLPQVEALLLGEGGWEWVKEDAYDDAYYRDHMHELPPMIHKERDAMIDVHHTILPMTARPMPDAATMLADAQKPSPLEGRGGGSAAAEGEGDLTLRQTAMSAISATRWVPEKGQNRITAMVEGRPDWVLSRQRAWGVPITLFVDRKSGAYLCDAAVNARIVTGIREGGVDAWSDEAAQGYLGDAYRLEEYERVTDILDVWFDSGCTHAFVLESGKWPDLVTGNQADLYLEGSDQHRGWFQSSLLESCGTRGRAPYKAVLTHGFTMDQKGMKMSKSLGNTINPLDLMRDNGADILRLWALTVDFTEDHRIGNEILKGVSDQYRKLRNTFRYLLGALEGFGDDQWVSFAYDEMPELECYILHLLADMDAKLRTAIDDYDFNTYVKLLSEFANNDLSAFFFDIRKDRLYCDARDTTARRAYLTVLAIVFDALVRYAAPVLVFTAEEVWQSRYPGDTGSVHMLEMPNIDQAWLNPALSEKWTIVRSVRAEITAALEIDRREKRIGSSLEAEVAAQVAWNNDPHGITALDFAELAIVSKLDLSLRTEAEGGNWVEVQTSVTENHKCGRCWRHLPEVSDDGALCGRCEDVVNG